MNKALICVQGISKDDKYMEKAFRAFTKEKGCTYAKVVFIDTEKYLVEKSLFGIYDRFGDWWQGVYKGRYLCVSADIYDKAYRLQADGYVVDIMGHSFGTLPMMVTQFPFKKMIACGSPLTSRFGIIRRRAESVMKYSCLTNNYQDYYYFWNNRDPVCSSPLIAGGTRHVIKAGCGHGFDKYLPDMDEEVRILK